jgi:hypothetical protein
MPSYLPSNCVPLTGVHVVYIYIYIYFHWTEPCTAIEVHWVVSGQGPHCAGLLNHPNEESVARVDSPNHEGLGHTPECI